MLKKKKYYDLNTSKFSTNDLLKNVKRKWAKTLILKTEVCTATGHFLNGAKFVNSNRELYKVVFIKKSINQILNDCCIIKAKRGGHD